MKLDKQQAIKALDKAEQKRFDREDQYVKLLDSGKVSGKTVCDYGDKCTVDAYEDIIRIANQSDGYIKKAIRQAVVSFVCELPEDRAAYRSGKMSCKQFFKRSGFSAFGMSHVFDGAIKNVRNAKSRRLEIFARLGA